MDYSRYETLAFSKEDGILAMSFNRPEAINTVNAKLHTELARVFADIAADKSVDVVILTGAGKTFSAGGDIGWFDNITEPELDALFIEARKIIVDLLEVPQPIIAAVHGAAAGLAATIALFCDIIYASDDARILDPHVRIGVTAGDGGAVIWPHLVGHARAKQYLLTGDVVGAVEAERIGLINQVVPQGLLQETARAMAKRLAGGRKQAIQTTKASVNKVLREQVNLILDTSLAMERQCFRSEDHKAAVRSFLQRKK
jgi:enoyl-CoA hydratase